MPIPIFTQLSSTEATVLKDKLNTEISNAGQSSAIVAVEGQVCSFFSCIIPTTRQAEFDAGDNDKKNNFATFSAKAQSPQYQNVDFLTAWEAEYSKIYP